VSVRVDFFATVKSASARHEALGNVFDRLGTLVCTRGVDLKLIGWGITGVFWDYPSMTQDSPSVQPLPSKECENCKITRALHHFPPGCNQCRACMARLSQSVTGWLQRRSFNDAF